MQINRRGLVTVFISADTETQLQAKLFDLTLDTDKEPLVVAIYPRGSKVIAWVKIEAKHVELAVSSQTNKKKTKKKVTKVS